MLLPAASTLESLGSFYLFILFKNLLLFFKFYFVFKLYNIVLVLPFRELLKILMLSLHPKLIEVDSPRVGPREDCF